MSNGWKPQATVAIVCITLPPLSFAVFMAAHVENFFGGWFCISSVISVVGIVCAISGVGLDNRASRVASWVCLSVQLLLIATAIVFVVMLSRGFGR